MLCNSSQVDLDHIDEKEFPEVQDLEFLDCILEEEVKLLMELYKQMRPEALSTPSCNNEPVGQLSSGAPSKHELPSGDSGQNQQAEDGQNKDTCVVGGSAFDWNFITIPGMEPVYYGRTKESFRAQAGKLTTG